MGCFCESRIRLFIDAFRKILFHPPAKAVVVIRQSDKKIMFHPPICFIYFSDLLQRSLLFSDPFFLISAQTAPSLNRDSEVIGNFFRSIDQAKAEQSCDQIDCIAIRSASKAMKSSVHFHTGILVRMKRTNRHAMFIHTDTITLCCISCRNSVSDCVESIHLFSAHLLSGNKNVRGGRHNFSIADRPGHKNEGCYRNPPDSFFLFCTV